MNRRWSMLLGWDLVGAVLIGFFLAIVAPNNVASTFAKDLYALGTSVLSIVFSVFIAALAIMISASDNDFIRFLEADNLFSDILWGFKATLVALFLALAFSVVVYVITAAQVSDDKTSQNALGVISYAVVSAYALLSTLSSTFAAIKFAEKRAEFLKSSP